MDYRIQAPLTYPIGPSDGGDSIPVAADIHYLYQPPIEYGDHPQLEVIDVTPLEERFGGTPYDMILLKAQAEEWLGGDGYEMACQRAKQRRGER